MPVKKCSGYKSSKLPSPLSAPDLRQISRTAQSEPGSGASALLTKNGPMDYGISYQNRQYYLTNIIIIIIFQ